MKKTTLILSVVVVLLIVLAPLIGNSFMQNMIDQNIKALEANGLVVKRKKDDSDYLNTQKHFEFILQNSEVFKKYLQQYTKTSLPSSFATVLEGALIGADISYSNIPFSKSIVVEIYPLELSKKVMAQIEQENPDVYMHLKKFLRSKGILQHVEYNLVSEDFNGFVKDIYEHYLFKKDAELLMQLEGVHFSGNGDFFAPKSFLLSVNKARFDVQDTKSRLSFDVNALRSSSEFISFSKYESSTKIFSLQLFLQGPQDELRLKTENIDLSSSSKRKNAQVSLDSKGFIGLLDFHSQKLDFTLVNANSDIEVSGLDEQNFETFSQLLAKSKTMNKALLQQKMQTALLELLSHGLKVDLHDLAFENIRLQEDLGSLKVHANMDIVEDKTLPDKFRVSPRVLLQNIIMHTKIRLANALFLKIIQDSPMGPMIVSYAKKDADYIYFDILFADNKILINDKLLQ